MTGQQNKTGVCPLDPWHGADPPPDYIGVTVLEGEKQTNQPNQTKSPEFSAGKFTGIQGWSETTSLQHHKWQVDLPAQMGGGHLLEDSGGPGS